MIGLSIDSMNSTISLRLGNVKYSMPSDDKSEANEAGKIRLNMMNVNDNEWMDQVDSLLVEVIPQTINVLKPIMLKEISKSLPNL